MQAAVVDSRTAIEVGMLVCLGLLDVLTITLTQNGLKTKISSKSQAPCCNRPLLSSGKNLAIPSLQLYMLDFHFLGRSRLCEGPTPSSDQRRD